jgi:hypothetical protein
MTKGEDGGRINQESRCFLSDLCIDSTSFIQLARKEAYSRMFDCMRSFDERATGFARQ